MASLTEVGKSMFLRSRYLAVYLLVLAVVPATSAISESETLYVDVRGSLQGATSGELPVIFAGEMAQANQRKWRFEPVSSSGGTSPNRIEWTLKPSADAAGAVKTYGFSRAMMTRLVGSRRVVSVEGRLYLNNAYETMVAGQIRDTGDPHDNEIAQEISELTKELVASANQATVVTTSQVHS